jgi:ATP-dependent Clp protease ATP-binding subunit ClpX
MRAYEEKIGARGLVSAVEKVLLKFEKRLPSTDIQKLVVTRAVVENPDRELERLLQEPSNAEMLAKFEMLLSKEEKAVKESIRNREGEFQKRYGMVFKEARIDLIARRVVEKGYDVNTVFEEVVEVQRQLEEFEKDFQGRNGILLRFNEEAIDQIMEIALDEDGKGAAILSRLVKDYEHGLRLIRDKIGHNEFNLTKEAIDDPEGYLNRMIREIYSKQPYQRFEDTE